MPSGQNRKIGLVVQEGRQGVKSTGGLGPNPKTESGFGLLAGFSNSNNDFLPLTHLPPILLQGETELPPKPQHLSGAGLHLSPKQASPEIKLSRSQGAGAHSPCGQPCQKGSAAAPCCSPVPCPGARHLLPGSVCYCHSLLAEELQYLIKKDN